jgi:hypothetical protein
MNITRTINSEHLWVVGVGLLRAVHLWTGRQYRRAVLRHALARIGREIAAERSARDRRQKLILGPAFAWLRRGKKLKAEIRGLGAGCSEGTKRRAI